MKRWILLVVMVALAAFGGWRFWLLGSIPRLPQSSFTIKLDLPGAEHQINGQGEWLPIIDGDSFSPGDKLRTNTGSATLAFARHAEVRLDRHTALTVEQSTQAADGSLQISLALESGQAWSVVEPLLHAEDTFQVHAGKTVALARGTSFNVSFANDISDISVTHDAVSVQSGSSTSDFVLVNEGYYLLSSRDGSLGKPQALVTQQDEWTTKNQGRDARFSQNVAARNRATVNLLAPARPESLLDGLAKVSEDLHLAVYRTQVPLRYAAYTSRRMIGLAAWCQAGNDGAAFQDETALEEELKSRLTGEQGSDYAPAMRAWLPYIFVRLEGVGPSSPCYRLKLHLEDLMQQLAGNDVGSKAFVQQVVIGMQLDEASSLITSSSLDDAGAELDAARQGLSQTSRALVSAGLSSSSLIAALQARQSLLSNREAGLQVHLATAISPPTISMTTSTSTVALLPETTSTPAQLPFTKIVLKTRPSNLVVGQTINFTVTAYRDDATHRDVTASSTITIDGTALSQTETFHFTEAGSHAIHTEHPNGGVPLSADLVLQVAEAPVAPPVVVVLQSLSITPASTSVSDNSQTTFHAIANYSDGISKDVTAQTTFTSSNLLLGFTLKNIFTTNANVQGQAMVTAEYAEGEKHLQASATINIGLR